jgi:hypothetical protein
MLTNRKLLSVLLTIGMFHRLLLHRIGIGLMVAGLILAPSASVFAQTGSEEKPVTSEQVSSDSEVSEEPLISAPDSLLAEEGVKDSSFTNHVFLPLVLGDLTASTDTEAITDTSPIIASAATNFHFVNSNCITRGPVTGDYVDVCVRISDSAGIFAYGALDARGPHAASTRVYITALHIRRYTPVTGPEDYRITAPGKWNYDYVNQWTGGLVSYCGRGYKAVMSYRIIWANGQVTDATNFYTPSGTTRWHPC